MNKWVRIGIQLLAGVFFLVGLAALPFGVWASPSQSMNPVIGWVFFLLYLGSILIPWAIAAALLRYSLRKDND